MHASGQLHGFLCQHTLETILKGCQDTDTAISVLKLLTSNSSRDRMLSMMRAFFRACCPCG